MLTRTRTFILCAAVMSGATATAVPMDVHAADSKGTDYWVMFNSNYDRLAGDRTVFIAADEATTGTVEVPGLGFSEAFSVSANGVATVLLPAAVMATAADGVQDIGVRVTADQEVAVYGLNQRQFTTDAFLALPIDALGSDYLLLAHPGGGNSPLSASQFGVVATDDGTTVTITPAANTAARVAGVPYTVNLDAGQVYQLQTSTFGADLTGTSITADKAIAVFGGNACGNVPNTSFGACDHMVEQMLPAPAWGQNFVTMPLATRLNGDSFRIVAAQDGTEVSINGALVATLARGQVHQQIIAGPAQITTSGPALVAQLSNGTGFDGVTSDPFMMLVPPFEQFLASYTVTTPASGFSGNYVNLVTPTAAVGSVLADGIPIPASDFVPIGSSGFSGVQIEVALGTHTFSSALPLGTSVYGFGSFDSYGYPGGLSLSEVARVESVSLAPEAQTQSIGDEACLQGTVLDQNAQPLAGIRVDFNVSGVHPASAFTTTDADGVASYCYTGVLVGDDTVEASVASLADSSTVSWVDPVIQMTMDIKFLSDPNAYNCSAKGVLPVTLFGSDDFDVTEIDVSTLRMERLDGMGTPVGPPRASSTADRGNPSDAGISLPGLSIYQPDGLLDIDVGFDVPALSRLVGCSALAIRDLSTPLVVTGELKDGRPFMSSNSDRLWIKQK